MTNSEKIKIAAAVLLERAPKIEGVSEHSLVVLRRAAERDDPGTLFVEFRRGERGSAPGVEIRVAENCFDDVVSVDVNWSSSGAQTVEMARDFSSLLAEVVFLADVVETELEPKCPSCGGLLEVDPSESSISYCSECGKEV